MNRAPAACLILFVAHLTTAQWNPYAGVVKSLTQGATVTASSGGSTTLAIDGNKNTCWQSGNPNAVLPQGYLSRPDLNILLGAGATSRFSRSGSTNGTNTTDGNPGTSATIAAVAGQAWVSYDFTAPVMLRTMSVKCSVPAAVRLYAFKSASDSVLIATLGSGDNFSLRRFSPMLNSVVKLKLTCTSSFAVFEVAAMSKNPTEYLVVDLLQNRQVGYIETRYWSDSTVVAGYILLSDDGANWTLAGNLHPYAFQTVIVRPPVAVKARYVKIELALVERDYAKCNVWEIKVYDEFGPYGAFPPPRPHPDKVRNIIGVNGIWGWGYNMFSNSIPQGEGPTRFSTMAAHARNYHNMHWDVTDPDNIPNYGTQPFGLALWWLDWDREYAAWKAAGLKVHASIQFSEWIPATKMANWDNPYQAAYNYGYAFARHFGPTHGNALVDVMEIGNEPWTYPASFYLTVLRGMAQGAKDADPALTVIPCALQAGNPETEYANGGNWLGARLTPTEAPLIDGINVHHYSFTYNLLGTRIAVYPEHPESDMRGVVNDINFRNANLPGKKIYLSEWGWDSDGAGEGCTFGECVSEYEQALYAVRGAMMFMRLGIDRITWYFYGNQASGHLYSRSGLQGQAPAFVPKKSLAAFQAFVHLLGNKYFLDTLREDNHAWVYLFGDSAGNPSHIAAWRPIKGDDNSAIQINLLTPLKPDSAWTINGLSNAGEPAPLPPYASGVMSLWLSSAPLVVKVSPANTGSSITWTGNVSGNWNDPLNWNTYTVPQASSAVIIPGGRPRYPSVYSRDIEITMLALNAGAQMLLVPGASLVVSNSLLIHGGTLHVTGTAADAPEIRVGGNLVKNAGTFNAGQGTVVLNGSNPQIISGALTFHHLQVNNHSAVTILGDVTVKGVISVKTGSLLVTNNKLTIESGGTLMHGQDTPGGCQGTVSGEVTFKRTGSTAQLAYNYWASPVQGADVNVLVTTPYYYDPAFAIDNSEFGLRMGWMFASGIMQAGVGYISQGAGTVSFTGSPTSAPISYPVSVTVTKNMGVSNDVAWNLVGNPFPSALDAEKFIDMNGPSGSGVIGGALYLWDDDATGGSGWNAVQDYAVWNRAGMVAGPNSGNLFRGSIASCQSFFVEKINDGADRVIFNNTMRTTDNDAFFRRMPVERLWINITTPSNDYNETLIAFIDDATDSMDWAYDAKKLSGNTAVSLYSIMKKANYAIQALAPLSHQKVIPLGFRTAHAGMHTLSLKQTEGLTMATIVLEDRHEGTLTYLMQNPAYSFVSTAGEFNDRFRLRLSPLPEGETILPAEDEPDQLFIYGNAESVFAVFRFSQKIKAGIFLYDISGRQLYSQESMTDGVQKICAPALSRTLYFVKVVTKQKTFSRKVFLGEQ